MQRLVRPFFIQRRVEGQNIGLFNQLVERFEITRVTIISTRRIAQQRFNAQRFQPLLQASADVTDTHNPHGTIGQCETIAFGQHQQRGNDVFNHRNRVATRRRGKPDVSLLQPRLINVIGARRRSADKLNRFVTKQRFINLRDGTYHQRIGIG